MAYSDDSAYFVGYTKPKETGRTPISAKRIAKKQTVSRGWSRGREWRCLVELWQHESGWRHNANNPYSTAYGIAQLLRTPETQRPARQIDRGLLYIETRYGSPCKAWEAWKARGHRVGKDWRGGWY